MEIMKKFVAAFALIGLSGCVSAPPKSLVELDTSLAANEEASTRLYPGKTIPEVRKAAHQVLYLLDPSDIAFDVESDGLMATRWSTFYAVFYTGFGRDWYSVDFEEANDGVIAKFGFASEMNAGMFTTPIAVSFKQSIPVSAHQNPNDFALFHDRVEYLLGMNSEWRTCAQAKGHPNNAGKELFLCDNLGLINKAP